MKHWFREFGQWMLVLPLIFIVVAGGISMLALLFASVTGLFGAGWGLAVVVWIVLAVILASS